MTSTELRNKVFSDSYKRQRSALAARHKASSGARRGSEYQFDCSEANVKDTAHTLAEANPVFINQIEVTCVSVAV